MTNFDYYVKGGKGIEGWKAFAKAELSRENGGHKRAIDRYNDWLLEEHEEPILDEVERAYLSNIIKPFRDKVLYIAKIDNSNTYFIEIGVNKKYGVDYALLPNFNCLAKMYVNMKPDYRYTLKELNL